MTPSDELDKEVAAAYEASGEKFWRLPLEESYWEQMKSSVADMLNTGSPLGGAITAGLFLKQVYYFLFLMNRERNYLCILSWSIVKNVNHMI